MTTHFLTPLLNEFTERVNLEVAKAKADIMSTLDGLSSFTVPAAARAPHPRSKAKAKRPRARK